MADKTFDPSQERTAKELARFSERDADKWLSPELQKTQLVLLFNPAEMRMEQDVIERQAAVYPRPGEAREDAVLSALAAEGFMNPAYPAASACDRPAKGDGP